MWWYGRGNGAGSWLPEEKKAKTWYGRGNSGGSWPPAIPRSGNTVVFFLSLNQKFVLQIFRNGGIRGF